MFRELWNASEKGYAYVKPLFDLIKDKKIEVVTPTEKELLRTLELPKSFGSGELDSLVICQARNAVFLSNEKRVMNYCIKNKITCFDLTDILAALWKFEIMNQAEVRKLILEIEEKDNVHVTSKDEIFK